MNLIRPLERRLKLPEPIRHGVIEAGIILHSFAPQASNVLRPARDVLLPPTAFQAIQRVNLSTTSSLLRFDGST